MGRRANSAVQLWIPAVQVIVDLAPFEPTRHTRARRRRGWYPPGQAWLPLPHVRPVLTLHRPLFRADCESVPRPCPWVSCRYNLFLDVNPHTGALMLNHPGLEPDEVRASCALDVADEYDKGLSLDHVGEVLGIKKTRVGQIEAGARDKLKAAVGAALGREDD